MNSYQVGNGVHLFDMIALASASYECSCNVCLVVTKSSAQNYQQYTSKQHSGCTFMFHLVITAALNYYT